MKKIMLCLLFPTIFLTGCSLHGSQNKLVDTNSKKTTIQNPVDTSEPKDDIQESIDTSKPKDDIQESIDTSKPKDDIQESVDTSEQENLPSPDNITDKNISEKVKNYITNGQENKPESQKVKWSNTFLNQVDIQSLYNQYILDGGIPDNLEDFSNYMTLNAPIPTDWQQLFEKDLYAAYGEKVVRLEHLKDDLYQVYIKKDNSEIPYVVVSSKTGYFHG